MEQLVARSYGMAVRALRAQTREADFTASTDAVDSYDEVVEQSWDLERFLKNPVVLFAHQSRELPIGKCTRVGVIDGKLECTIQFATAEMNPKAEQVFRMVQEKMLNAVSVGFMPRSIRHEMRDGKDVYVLADNELHEISVVPIPANPEALAKMKAKARSAAQSNPGPGPTESYMDKTNDPGVAEKAASEKDLTVALAERDEARTERDAVRAERDAAVTERDAARADAEKTISERDALAVELKSARADVESLRGQLVDKEVDALVGVKILPAEREVLASLAKKDRASFDALIGARPALSLLSQVVPSTKTIEPTSGDPAQELAALAMRVAE